MKSLEDTFGKPKVVFLFHYREQCKYWNSLHDLFICFDFHSIIYLFPRWTGVIGALVEDDADIGATYFFVTEARSQVVEFSPAITEGILR